MVVKDEARDFEAIPTGVQPAVCSAIHDLGMQSGFQGKIQHQLAIVWELSVLRTEGDFAGKRFIVCRKYNCSLNERSNLSKDLESWRGRAFTADEREGFEIDVLVNKNCNLNMVEKTNTDGRTFVNIAGITGTVKGQAKMVPEAPGYMPKWIMGLIGEANSDTGAEDFDDDIPF